MEEFEFIKELERYTRAEIESIWFKPIESFITKHINESFNGVAVFTVLSGLPLKKIPSKGFMAQVCARFYTNKELLAAFYNSWPKKIQQVIEKATWNEVVHYDEINEIFGKQMFALKESGSFYYSRPELRLKEKLEKWEPFLLGRRVYNYKSLEDYLYRADVILRFPSSMKISYSEILPKPKNYFLNNTTQPKETTVFTAEETIFQEMPLILAQYYQGKFKYTQKGYPNRASGRKMDKTLQLKRFPGVGPSEIRALMIAGLFSDDFKIDSLTEPTLEIIKRLFQTDFQEKPNIPYLLPHLKKLNGIRRMDFNGVVSSQILQVLSKFQVQEWLSFENIKDFVGYHFIPLMPVSHYDLSRIDVADDIEYPEFGSIEGIASTRYVEIPLLAGHIYLLAAFGLMEIAIDEDKEPKYSYYEGLKACRLTSLGAFILGEQKNYTPPELEHKTQLTFDENAPVIRVQGNLSLGNAMLEKYVEKVSENRYQFSPGKFLKDCKTQKDLKDKIQLFKHTIQEDLPPFWLNYLDQLVVNSQAIGKKNSIFVYKLPPENKDLHRIVARDPVLRTVIIKAENFYILLEKKNKAKFVNRMKELGYLVG